MEIKVLGCSGGIGGGRFTTSLLVDGDVLVDAGTGAMSLAIDELVAIDKVFLTHTHLDHVVSLPLMVDTVGPMRDKPVTVFANCASLANLHGDIFNWRVWPDFFRIPTPDAPFLVSRTMEVGQLVDLGDGRRIRALPVVHTVPAVAYHLSGPKGSLVFSGDTTVCDAFWNAVNGIDDIRYLILETAFSEDERDIAVASKHLCPSMFADELTKYRKTAPIYITHMKPRSEDLIMEEVHAGAGGHEVHRLRVGQVFEI